MILGIGVDIIETSRIDKALKRSGERFLQRIFTQNEILISENKSTLEGKNNYYAKRFAAKEAFSKATGLGIGRGFDFVDVEITNDENGKPEIKLSAKAEAFLKQHFSCDNFQINLSIADTKDLAQAFVVISK